MDEEHWVKITNKKHPHYSETGKLTGKVIRVGKRLMAELKIQHCSHGTDACFVSNADIQLIKAIQDTYFYIRQHYPSIPAWRVLLLVKRMLI